MKISKRQLREEIRKAIQKVLAENQPAPSKPKPQERPGPIVHPGKPTTDPGKPVPRRPLGNPNVTPKPKASMKETEQKVLDKIVQRFKSLKSNKLN